MIIVNSFEFPQTLISESILSATLGLFVAYKINLVTTVFDVRYEDYGSQSINRYSPSSCLEIQYTLVCDSVVPATLGIQAVYEIF